MIKDVCELKECPECGSINIIHNKQRNQLICRDCGVIYEPMAPDREKKFERVSEITKTAAAAKPKKKARRSK